METILNTILTHLPSWPALVLIVVGAVSLALGLIRLGYGAAVKGTVLDLIASLGDALYELSDSDRVEDFDKSLSLMQDWVNNLKEEKKAE